ncbi:MAG: poly(3-hydroxyalkanoate) depolymerase [Hyphomicrobiales bacterium]|nr:poly(3-hydroxyalkanoate) depolymerase [Hyphomicrobiales bacterium]MBV8440992.1 poly(3-hydroxyalkanoate) depolymerase [Hyphomicrobiales bacterium]
MSDRAGLAPDDTAERPGSIEARMMSVGGQELMVAVKRGGDSRPPLLLFNGIGANWQLARPFLEALTETTAIIFDVPGIGGSPSPKRPYRPSSIAQLGARLVSDLGYDKVDVAGVSWGGGIAQQFAYQYPQLCRRLVLAATSPGAISIPGSPKAILRMATPRRYLDKNYMRKIAPDLYGGAFRKDPSMIGRHTEAMSGALGIGYVYQLLAMAGWTSLPWLSAVRQPTLILMGRDDPLVPVANGRILARLIPNARLEVIEDGHLFIVARPVETARRIERFLGGEP